MRKAKSLCTATDLLPLLLVFANLTTSLVGGKSPHPMFPLILGKYIYLAVFGNIIFWGRKQESEINHKILVE